MISALKVRQNPLLIWLGVSLIAFSVVAEFLLSDFAGTRTADTAVFTNIVLIVGILLLHTGTELQISDVGIKLGFTMIPWIELEEIRGPVGGGDITMRTKRNREYRLRHWHYHSQDWPLLAGWLVAFRPAACENGLRSLP